MFKNKYFNLSISTFTYYISISVALSIFPLILRDAGENMFFIGISNAMQRLAGLSFLLFVPYLVHKIGLKLLSVIIIALYTIPLALMPFYINYKFWLVLVALFGIGVRGFTTFLYSTINITATDEKRGLVNGIMNVVCLLAMSAMPVIFYFTSNYVIFAICIVLNILNLFSFLQLENEYKNITFIKNIKIVTFLRENILLYISKFSFEFIKTTLFVFTIIYANQNGWRDKEAGLLLSLYSTLGLVFSIPTGWIFDKYKLKGEAILVLATLITFLAAISIPDVITSHVLTFILYGIMGLSTDFIFIGSFSVLNGKYQKEELISANSTLQFFGGIANVSSAFITGFCIQKGGSIILPVLVLCFVFLTCLLFKMFYKRRSY